MAREQATSRTETMIRPISRCRLCGSSALTPVFSLGDQYLAGVFLRAEQAAASSAEPFRHKYPLELVRCDPDLDIQACGLLQLGHTVARELLFDHYGYRSGINQTMRDHLASIATTAEWIAQPSPGDTVLDIGCNDGSLLLSYRTAGLDRLGIDPADDVTRYARERGLEVVDGFFSAEAFRRVRPGRTAKIVTSIAMFYDLEDPGSFAHDVAEILADDGVWVVEVGWIVAMLHLNAFDAVCHEHLEYYGLRQLERLLAEAGLCVQRIETNDINGGSLCLYIGKVGGRARGQADDDALELVRAQERALSLETYEPYETFRINAASIRHELRRLLDEIHARGERVFVYGASTKGNVILQYCGLGSEVISAAADRNPDKWGREMLGTNIRIVSEEQARAEQPEYFLVLPYHFLDEFKRREAEFLRRGGKFILPMPTVHIVGA